MFSCVKVLVVGFPQNESGQRDRGGANARQNPRLLWLRLRSRAASFLPLKLTEVTKSSLRRVRFSVLKGRGSETHFKIMIATDCTFQRWR